MLVILDFQFSLTIESIFLVGNFLYKSEWEEWNDFLFKWGVSRWMMFFFLVLSDIILEA